MVEPPTLEDDVETRERFKAQHEIDDCRRTRVMSSVQAYLEFIGHPTHHKFVVLKPLLS
jgi:hypothetical protein